MSNGLIMIIFLSLYAFGFWYGKNLIIDNISTNKYNAGTIISAFFCFLIGGSSVGQISPFFKNIADGRVAMTEFLDLLKREKTLVEPANGIKLDKINNIILEDINFSYKEDQPVLQNVSI
jgi:ABC-type multidrug transport system fused ATPase/permease subunit